jgi:transposase
MQLLTGVMSRPRSALPWLHMVAPVHTPPKRGMTNPPAWNPALYAKRHQIENLFSRLKDWTRIALRRDKTRRSWMGFANLVATMTNLRIAEFSHRP